MKHGVRRGIAAALGIGLLLALGAGPAAADNPDDAGNQGDGLDCDVSQGAHYPFYVGPSASKTYDQKFSRLGSDPIPDLGETEDDIGTEWTPQGLAYWPDWDGNGKDLLLVTAYADGALARIHGIDAETGEPVGTVRIVHSHVGGIAIIGDYAYVSSKGSKSVVHYRLSDLRKGLKADDPDESGDPDHIPPFVEQIGDPTKVDSGVAFLGTDGSRLYAGRYTNEQKFVSVMVSYKPDGNGKLTLSGRTYVPPIRAQGMTVVDGDFYFSVSPTRPGEEKGRRSFIYRVTPEDMKKNLWDGTLTQRFQWASECFRAPSMSEGMAANGGKGYLIFESGSVKYRFAKENRPVNPVSSVHVGELGSGDGDGGGDGPGQGNTSLSYTGPSSADFHDAFRPSARLAGPSGPVSGAKVSFTLGRARSGDSCTATSDSSGVAECSLTPSLRPGTYTLTMRFGGGGGLDPATETVTFTVTKQETALRYTGPKRVANGTPAKLSGRLTEEDAGGAPVSGRSVTLALGRGDDRQACTGETDGDGEATCVIDEVDQPLNDDATVPVSLAFGGDDFYKPSRERTTVLLEYYTGRSYGVSADVSLAGLGAGVEPTPDTGKVRTARASTHDPGCTASLGVLPLLRTGTLCPKVVTSLAPGTSRAKAAVQDARIGLPGLPLIEVESATARSTSTCDAGGSSRGSMDLRLRVGGRLVDVTGKVNAEIDIPGAARLVVNEQKPVPGAEHGRIVNAVHLTAAGGAADVVIASATSDVHNCA